MKLVLPRGAAMEPWYSVLSPGGGMVASREARPGDGSLPGRPEDAPGIALWDLRSGRLARAIGERYPFAPVAFSPHGGTLASGSSSSSVTLWNPRTGDRVGRLVGPGRDITALQWSPSGRSLAVGDEAGEIFLWDVYAGRLQRTLGGHTNSVISLAYSPDRKLLVSGSNVDIDMGSAGEVFVWRAGTGERLHHLGYGGGSVAFAPDGKLIAVGSRDNSVKLYDPATGRLLRSLDSGWTYAVAFSPDSRTVADVSEDTADGRLGTDAQVWSTRTGKRVRTIRGASSPFAIAARGKVMITGCGSERMEEPAGLTVREANSGRALATLVHLQPSKESGGGDGWVAFTPAGDYDGSVGVDARLRWRVGKEVVPGPEFARTHRRPALLQRALSLLR